MVIDATLGDPTSSCTAFPMGAADEALISGTSFNPNPVCNSACCNADGLQGAVLNEWIS